MSHQTSHTNELPRVFPFPVRRVVRGRLWIESGSAYLYMFAEDGRVYSGRRPENKYQGRELGYHADEFIIAYHLGLLTRQEARTLRDAARERDRHDERASHIRQLEAEAERLGFRIVPRRTRG